MPQNLSMIRDSGKGGVHTCRGQSCFAVVMLLLFAVFL